jgi:lipoyl(octanoyl) transferase
VPCGVVEHGVTSFADLGLNTTMAELDYPLKTSFGKIFGGSELM